MKANATKWYFLLHAERICVCLLILSVFMTIKAYGQIPEIIEQARKGELYSYAGDLIEYTCDGIDDSNSIVFVNIRGGEDTATIWCELIPEFYSSELWIFNVDSLRNENGFFKGK